MGVSHKKWMVYFREYPRKMDPSWKMGVSHKMDGLEFSKIPDPDSSI